MHGVKKLFFLGSSCVYPRLAPQPIKEEHLLTSEFEPTNEPYAIVKLQVSKCVKVIIDNIVKHIRLTIDV